MYVRFGYTYLQEGQSVTSSILNVIHVCHLRSSTSACGSETTFLGKMMLRVVCGLDNLEHQVWNSPDEVDGWRLRKHKPCFFVCFLVHFVVCITSNTQAEDS